VVAVSDVTINRNLCSSWTGTGRGFGTVKRREWRSSSVVGDELLKRPMEVVAIFDGDLVANGSDARILPDSVAD
jgi:hypothetical protein